MLWHSVTFLLQFEEHLSYIEPTLIATEFKVFDHIFIADS